MIRTEKRKAVYRFLVILILFMIIWCLTIIIDYRKVCHSFEKPLIATPTQTADDGGSGIYRGLGYFFEIEGNFMPEDEYPGITRARFYLFDKLIKECTRE